MIMERGHKELGGYQFTILPPREDFYRWIEKRGGLHELTRLKTYEKEKVFLKWKWGFSDKTNQSLEHQVKERMFLFKDTIPDNEGLRWFVDNTRNNERICFGIRSSLGLVKVKNEAIDQMIAGVGGEVIDD